MGRHGGGVRSGGGGGFRSGGGFRGGGIRSGGFRSGGSLFNNHHHHHTGTTVFVGSGWGWGWGGPRYGGGGCSCCRIINVGIFVLALIIIIIVSSVRPKDRTTPFQATAYEYRTIQASTTWYSSIEVEDRSGGMLETYLLPSKPQPGPLVTKSEFHSLSVATGSYEFYAYRMLSGSSVSVSFSLSSSVQFYIVKGEYFSQWESGDNSQVDYNIYTNYLSGKVFNAYDEDDYYFIWESSTTSPAYGSFNITLQLATYDLSNYIDLCTQYNCVVDLAVGSDQVVVIYAKSSGIPDDVFQGSYTKNARNSIYWGIFGTLITVVVLIGCVVAIIARRSQYSSASAETAPLPSTPAQPYVATPVPYAYPAQNPPPVVPGSDYPSAPVVSLEDHTARGYSSPLPPFPQNV